MLALNLEPANVVSKVQEYENKHQEKVDQELGGFANHFEIGFDQLVKLIELVNYVEKKTWSTARTVQFLAVKNNLAPLYSSYNRLISGFYGDALILLRTVYETMLRILFISYMDCDPYIPFVRNVPDGKPKFNVTNFTRDHLKVEWGSIYRMLSTFAHSNSYDTLADARKLHEQGHTEVIGFNLEYDEEMMSAPANLTYFLLWGLFKLSLPLFLSEEKDENVLLYVISGFESCERAFGAIVKEMPNNLSNVYDDMERIVAEVKEKEGIT